MTEQPKAKSKDKWDSGVQLNRVRQFKYYALSMIQ